MSLELVTVACLKDNYNFLLHDPETGEAAVVDVADAAPVQKALAERGWTLSKIFLTHHHSDHIDGVPALVAATGAKVYGAAADKHRLPPLDFALAANDILTVGKRQGVVIPVPGHTLGHIAFHFADDRLCFSGDSLMAGGCGRLFEGTPKLAWGSLVKLAALPPDTLICSGHEYTASNLLFAASVDVENPALAERIEATSDAVRNGRPTVPSLLSLELATNPFLRATDPQIARTIGTPDAPPADVFATLRAMKDRF